MSKHYFSRQRPLLIIKFQPMLTSIMPPPAFTSPLPLLHPAKLFFSTLCLYLCYVSSSKLNMSLAIVLYTFLYLSCLHSCLFSPSSPSGISQASGFTFPTSLDPLSVFISPPPVLPAPWPGYKGGSVFSFRPAAAPFH